MLTMKDPVKSSSLAPKKYDATFKQEAVSLWQTSGKTASVVAKELGINVDRLYHWRKDFAPPPGGEGGGAKSREQLVIDNAALRQELDYVRQQRDILKKTLGILCEAPKSATNALKR